MPKKSKGVENTIAVSSKLTSQESVIMANGDTITFNYDPSPLFSEISATIDICANQTVSNDYQPFMSDFYLNFLLATYFTDIELPEDIDEQYKLIMQTPVRACIERIFNVTELKEYVDKMVAHRLKVVENNSEFNGLVSDVRAIVAKLDKVIKPSAMKKAVENFSKIDTSKDGVAEIVSNIINKKNAKEADNVIPIQKV